MVHVQFELPRVTDGLAFLHEAVLPQLQVGSGFCSAEVLIDRHSGNGIFVTTWENEDGATRAETILDQLREEAVERVGTKFFGTDTYVLVGTSAQLD
jgi:hypothetical protein